MTTNEALEAFEKAWVSLKLGYGGNTCAHANGMNYAEAFVIDHAETIRKALTAAPVAATLEQIIDRNPQGHVTLHRISDGRIMVTEYDGVGGGQGKKTTHLGSTIADAIKAAPVAENCPHKRIDDALTAKAGTTEKNSALRALTPPAEKPCPHARVDHNGECLDCDEPVWVEKPAVDASRFLDRLTGMMIEDLNSMTDEEISAEAIEKYGSEEAANAAVERIRNTIKDALDKHAQGHLKSKEVDNSALCGSCNQRGLSATGKNIDGGV